MRGNSIYIREEHFLAGQTFHEEKVSNTPEYHRLVAIRNCAEPNHDDCACFIMIKLYDIMNNVFAGNRSRVREDFALFFGYMFNTWSDLPKVCVSDKSPDLRWDVPFEKITRLSDENIRDCAVKNVKG